MKTAARALVLAVALLSGAAANAALLTQPAAADLAMNPLMGAWQQASGISLRWQHGGNDAAIGALMFELVDFAPMSRAPLPIELAPYVHQFMGDMMKAPVLVRVGKRSGNQGEQALLLAINKRPDSPLPLNVQAFVRFALSPAGQALVARQPGLSGLSPAEAAQELPKIDAYLAKLDAGIARYAAQAQVQGQIRSIGSDGMKSLMERWMNDFRVLQPGVHRGERWEHLGTLNGFHALMAGETDLAPMGRELWPDEAASYASLHGGVAPFEIRVAHGGFNTQQRTTAQAVFVNPANPLKSITMAQLAAVFGKSPTITRWGQLSLTGEWADKPITLVVPPLITPNAMSMQAMALKGGAWNANVHAGTVAETAKALAADTSAIGFGGFEDAPGLKTLAVVPESGGAPVTASGETVANGQYPLTRYMYIRLQRAPGQPLPATVKEFLRYVLSAQGQEPILYSGYFPLTAKEVAEELAKLE